MKSSRDGMKVLPKWVLNQLQWQTNGNCVNQNMCLCKILFSLLFFLVYFLDVGWRTRQISLLTRLRLWCTRSSRHHSTKCDSIIWCRIDPSWIDFLHWMPPKNEQQQQQKWKEKKKLLHAILYAYLYRCTIYPTCTINQWKIIIPK